MSLNTTPDSYTKLLIHSDTSDGSTTFVDSSANGHTITTSGDPTHEDTKKIFGSTSMLHMDRTLVIEVQTSGVKFSTGIPLLPVVPSKRT